jgi:C-terminal processing protease CtpA/Prc
MLRRFTVTLDYQSKRILLKPNAQFIEPYETDMSGLELVTKTDDFRVIQIKRVRAHFPADEAGLREGDKIISINGHPATEFDLDKLIRMFKQAGKAYLLTIRRGDEVMRVKLKMKRMV